MENGFVFSAFNESFIQQTLQTDSLAVTAVDIFGMQSHFIHKDEMVLQGTLSPLTGNILYQIAIVVIFASYCIIIFRYRTLIDSMMKTVWSRLHRKKLVEERNRIFSRLLKLLTATGMAAIAVAGVKFVEIFDNDTASAHRSLHWLATPVAIILLYLIHIYRLFVLRTAGYLTYRIDFAKRIVYLTQITFSIGCIFCVPSMIVFAVSTTPAHMAFVYLIGFEVIIWVIYLLVQTYGLFVKENVSILHWFLYLCGVEILPVSFLFVALTRILMN